MGFFIEGGNEMLSVVVNDLIGRILGEWCMGVYVNVGGLPLVG